MPPEDLLQLLPGPFNFLRRDRVEVQALIPDADQILPLPGLVYLEDEGVTPTRGFPVLLSPGMARLRSGLAGYLEAEERAQLDILRRRSTDRKAYATARETYRTQLTRAVVHSTLSSYGRNFPGVFWLQHSLDIARILKHTPQRVARTDSEIGREQGATLKYRVLERYLELAMTECYEAVSRLAVDTEELEEALFPRLLTRMRDNVLLLTEDHISADLAELTAYFSGSLRVDGRGLRRRLAALAAWNRELLESDPEVRAAVGLLLRSHRLTPTSGEAGPERYADEVLVRPGYLRYLARHRGYSDSDLLDERQIEIWESLLLKLKEFELVHALRRFLIPVRREGDRLICRPEGVGGAAPLRSGTVLSPATRPMDFTAAWVVDPLVHRFGLIYDLTDFSDIVNLVRRSGSDVQDDAFRRMFSFQRRVNRLASAHRVSLEKYLGDGAFFSSRQCLAILWCAVQIQRAYRQALEEGFPFDRGLRLALNYGQYRLIPMGTAGPGDPLKRSHRTERYEFFGHGLVELSRLITGKATREMEEIKTMLIAQGYPEATVYRFFSPLLQRNVEEERTDSGFYAYINRSGNLVNEGIVATEAFVRQLDHEIGSSSLSRVREHDRTYVLGRAEQPGWQLDVGLRKLGLAHLKGLGEVPVYEVIDGDRFPHNLRSDAGQGSLLATAESSFAAARPAR